MWVGNNFISQLFVTVNALQTRGNLERCCCCRCYYTAAAVEVKRWQIKREQTLGTSKHPSLVNSGSERLPPSLRWLQKLLKHRPIALSPSLPFPLCSAAPFDQVRVRGVKVESYVVTRTEIRDVGKQMRG